MGRKSKKEGIYACVCLNHVTVPQKLTTLESNYRPIKLLQKEKKENQATSWPSHHLSEDTHCPAMKAQACSPLKRKETSGGILIISSSCDDTHCPAMKAQACSAATWPAPLAALCSGCGHPCSGRLARAGPRASCSFPSARLAGHRSRVAPPRTGTYSPGCPRPGFVPAARTERRAGGCRPCARRPPGSVPLRCPAHTCTDLCRAQRRPQWGLARLPQGPKEELQVRAKVLAPRSQTSPVTGTKSPAGRRHPRAGLTDSKPPAQTDRPRGFCMGAADAR